MTVYVLHPDSFRGGFTLLEIVVVIALIILLAALLLPVLAETRESTRQSSCLSNVRQISLAQRLYVEDWDDLLPAWWTYTTEGAHRPFTFWTETFQPYLSGYGVLICRSFSWGDEGAAPGIKLADYALLTWGPGGIGSPSDPHWLWAGPPMTLSAVRRPSATFNLVDGYTTTEWTRGLFARHRDGFNVGFLDGHARWLHRGRAFAVARDRAGSFYLHISADR